MWKPLPPEYSNAIVPVSMKEIGTPTRFTLESAEVFVATGLWHSGDVTAYLNADRFVRIDGTWKPVRTSGSTHEYWESSKVLVESKPGAVGMRKP
jgi:hypothetical protein